MRRVSRMDPSSSRIEAKEDQNGTGSLDASPCWMPGTVAHPAPPLHATVKGRYINDLNE